MTAKPIRLLLSHEIARHLGARIGEALAGGPWVHIPPDEPGADFDAAFVSRDVTGLSAKHDVKPATRAFYDALLAAPSLQWLHVHSAGADRPAYLTLLERGVRITTSAGTNASVVAQSAVSGILALARHLPLMLAAQREHRWTHPMASGTPRDLERQLAVVVGWGHIGQRIGALLQALGLRVAVARHSPAPVGSDIPTVQYAQLSELLRDADWLVLCCPLSDQTRRLVDAATFALLPPTARVINVARGEIVEERALIDALAGGRLAGAYLDVFEQEPLPADSPLWDLPNVIVTPHCAGFSDGNEERVARIFLGNLGRWARGDLLPQP